MSTEAWIAVGTLCCICVFIGLRLIIWAALSQAPSKPKHVEEHR